MVLDDIEIVVGNKIIDSSVTDIQIGFSSPAVAIECTGVEHFTFEDVLIAVDVGHD